MLRGRKARNAGGRGNSGYEGAHAGWLVKTGRRPWRRALLPPARHASATMDKLATATAAVQAPATHPVSRFSPEMAVL
jgi:hypothetical protein